MVVVTLQPLSSGKNDLSHIPHTEKRGLGVTYTTGISPFIDPSPSSLTPLFPQLFLKLKKEIFIQMWLRSSFPALSLPSELGSLCFFLCLHTPFL